MHKIENKKQTKRILKETFGEKLENNKEKQITMR